MFAVFRFRSFHRKLSVFVGIQILLWTLRGLSFAWTNLDEIHGDHLRNPAPGISWGGDWVAPTDIDLPADVSGRIESLDVVEIGGHPHYRLRYSDAEGEKATILANARTGEIRGELTRDEAVAMAVAGFQPDVPVAEVILLGGDLGGHHEYRGGPLPAWQIRFDHPSAATVYVAAREGSVVTLRHRNWRIFDFLWMLHTMDYQGRDDINNPLLRTLSILALIVVVSGFTLWAVTGPRRRRRKSSSSSTRD